MSIQNSLLVSSIMSFLCLLVTVIKGTVGANIENISNSVGCRGAVRGRLCVEGLYEAASRCIDTLSVWHANLSFASGASSDMCSSLLELLFANVSSLLRVVCIVGRFLALWSRVVC